MSRWLAYFVVVALLSVPFWYGIIRSGGSAAPKSRIDIRGRGAYRSVP